MARRESDRFAIAFLSHAASPAAPTGAERSLGLLAAGLHGRGHRTGVAFPAECAEGARLRGAGIDVRTVACRACWLTYWEPRPWPVVAAKWLRYAWPQRATARLRRWVESTAADVVHVNCLPHLRGARAGAASGRPVVWHVREILPAGARRRWFAAALRRHATAVVAVSEAVAAGLREEGLAERLTVIPNGVELAGAGGGAAAMPAAREALGLPADGVWIGLLGQLVPHKGALDFVEAARRAAAREPALRFLLAGAGPQAFRGEVAGAIERGGLAARIHLLPAQPDGAALLAACDVVCLATRTPDPLPRAVLEAMAAAKPVAAYRSGGTVEMVRDGETGSLVDSGDVEALSRAFVDLGRDAARRAAWGRAGAERARREFSLARHLDRMEALYRSLLR